jgi:hypothetical protein
MVAAVSGVKENNRVTRRACSSSAVSVLSVGVVNASEMQFGPPWQAVLCISGSGSCTTRHLLSLCHRSDGRRQPRRHFLRYAAALRHRARADRLKQRPIECDRVTYLALTAFAFRASRDGRLISAAHDGPAKSAADVSRATPASDEREAFSATPPTNSAKTRAAAAA